MELKNELFHLVSFMLTSADGLGHDPAEYGTFRLLDSAGRLLGIMKNHDLSDPFLEALQVEIDEQREGSMDPDSQGEELKKLIIKMVQEIPNRI